MEGPTPEISMLYRNVAVWGITIIGILGTAIASFFHSRLKYLEANAITKEYFKEKMSEVDVQRLEFHRQNIERLSEIQASIKPMYQQAIDIGRIQEQLKNLQDRENVPHLFDEVKRIVEMLEKNSSHRSIQR